MAIIGADFTPSSMPPALRIRFFASHLPEFGWEPTIITTNPSFYESDFDPENERLLPDTLEVIRTRALPVRVTRRFGVGDVGMRSMWHHWRALCTLCRDRKFDLVFIPVPPSVPMVLGRLAHIRFGIPYVVDYIDPWVTEYYWTLPRAERPPKWVMAYTLSRLLEPFALKNVAHIVGVSAGVTQSVISRYPKLGGNDATEIPYGGEADDINYIRARPRRNPIFEPEDGLLHVSYIGACTPGMYRTVKVLFAAVARGLERSPQLFKRLRLHFVGTTYDPKVSRISPLLELANDAGIQDIVDEHPQRVAYLDALQLLLDSHALLVLGYDEPHYAASKIYPYVLARKPILAILHEASSPVAILRELGAAHVETFGPSDPVDEKENEISRALEQILLLSPGYEPPTRWEAFEPYTARAMTARLAGAFDRALEKKNGLNGREAARI